MKTFILSAACLLLVAFSVSAQKEVNKEQRKGKKEAMKASLDLSQEQLAQWESIDEKYKAEHDKLKANESLSKEERKKASKELRTSKKDAIGAILTEKQKEQLRESKEKERDERRANKEAKMFKELGLSAEQQKQFRDVSEKYDGMIVSIKEDSSLDEEAKKKKLMDVRKKKQKSIASILTPEQKAKMKELKQERKSHKKK